MEYKLFDEFITLQALLKEVGIIQSGGAIKSFLADHQVFFNGELENRRGKKLRIGDVILLAPSQEEILEHQEEQAEKKRVADLVKAMNKDLKKSQPAKKEQKKRKPEQKSKKAPVRFPGT